MSIHQDQIQAPAIYSGPLTLKIDENGRESSTPLVSEKDKHEYEWADVLKEVEPYY